MMFGPLAVKRQRAKRIFSLGLPIMGGMVSQNLLNLVDSLMVSRLDEGSLGAVGLGGFANFVASAFVTGLAAGVQAMAARRKGAGREAETAVALNGGLLMVVVLAIPLSVSTIVLSPYWFPYLNSDAVVVGLAVPYLQIRLIAMVAVGANYAFRGYWNGINRPWLYLRTLLVMHACNVVISYVLIFGKWGAPAMGVNGAALGTTLSTFIGTAYYFYLGQRHARTAGFLRGLPSMRTMRVMFRLSVPSGFQTLFFSAGLLALFVIVGMLGRHELDAAQVLINIMLIAILPGLGLGLAAATLVGQALGAKDKQDALRWGWDVVKVAALVMCVLGLPMLVAPELILSQFFSKAPASLEASVLPLRLVGATIGFDAMGLVLLNALLGAGASRTVMIVSVSTQWGLFLPVAFLVGPTLGYGLLGIWVAQICYRTLQAFVLAALWQARGWANIKM